MKQVKRGNSSVSISRTRNYYYLRFSPSTTFSPEARKGAIQRLRFRGRRNHASWTVDEREKKREKPVLIVITEWDILQRLRSRDY